MTTSMINQHRPAALFIATAAAVAATAAGVVALSLAPHAGAPGQHPQPTSVVQPHQVNHFYPTIGGRVLVGH